MESPVFRVKKTLLANPPQDLLSGRQWSPGTDQLEAIEDPIGVNGEPVRLDHQLVEQLFAAALRRGEANDTTDNYALDRWLAPRLHSAIRVPRRIASDRRFWAWIAMRFGAAYVHGRFENGGVTNGWRYTDTVLRNGVSRLWWAAEMLRNGIDYSMVDQGLQRVRTAEFALELRYSWYRPAAIAFVEIAEDEKLNDDMMSALSRRANAYLPLAPLEAIGFDEGPSPSDESWWSSTCTLEELLQDEPPDGPRDGFADTDAINAIRAWYAGVLEEERAAEDHPGVVTVGS